MKYTCELCKKEFLVKNKYERHMNRINPCIKDEIKCRQCNKCFFSLQTLQRHLNKKIECNNNMYYQCEICKKQYLNKYRFNQHMKKIHPDKQNIQQIINNGTINNNTTNNYNIIIVPFGQEKIDYIDIKRRIEILKNGRKCMNKLIQDKHYNTEHPENHNMYISDFNRKKIVVYTGEIWKVCDIDEIFDNVNKTNLPCITTWYTDYKDNLTDQANKEILKIINTFDKDGQFVYKNRLTGGMDRNGFEEYKLDIELVLYNYRDIVKQTKKEIDIKNEIINIL